MNDSANRKKIIPTAWPSGQSGNPVGRPKINPDLRIMSRDLCAEVIETWVEIMRDTTAKKADRIKAGENIWAVAYGRPGPQEAEPAKERPIMIPAEFVE